MNIRRCLLTLVSIAAAHASLAQPDISGIWAGTLTIDANTAIEMHFLLTRAPDGSASAVLSSPTPNTFDFITATNVRFADNRLIVTVSDAERYEGTYADGRFSGNWYRQDTPLPLDLVPFSERKLSAEVQDALRGSWVGELLVPERNNPMPVVLRFRTNDEGELVAFLAFPGEATPDFPLTIEYDADILKLTIQGSTIGGYTARLAGDTMDGTFSNARGTQPLVMRRGEYAAPGQPMPAEAVERLAGSWTGRITNRGGGSAALVFRFAASADGGLHAYADIPEQGRRNVPMTEVTLEDGRLTLEAPSARGTFRGTVSANEIVGTWAQDATSQPVTMTRGEYTPTVTVLDLPDGAFERLAGVWRGQTATAAVRIRFERTAAGEPVAFFDAPFQNVDGAVVARAALTGNEVTIDIPAVDVTVTGTLSGREIRGRLRRRQADNSLTLTRQ